MNTGHLFSFCDLTLNALSSGALWIPAFETLVVSDLHLGKSERAARRGGTLLPPYETRETLDRLSLLVEAHRPQLVICLGDSFDDLAAAEAATEETRRTLARLQAGRDWVWIEGNHDPGPVEIGGRHLAELVLEPLTFRHIATGAGLGEISGHYHPKCAVPRAGTRPAFLIDTARVILPAFGTFTGGLRGTHPALRELMAPDAVAVLTGRRAVAVPFSATC